MRLQLRVRLGTMMFLEYFIWGSWYVTVGTWLSTALHFNAQQIGIVAGATAVGAIVAPLFVGVIADKLFSTERVLAVLHVAGGLFLLLASLQTHFAPLYTCILVYCLFYMPTMALTNSLSFRQMSDPKLEFGAIRVLGTFGWIVAGLLVGSLGIEATAYPPQIAGVSSIVMGLYCLTLPHTPPLAAQDSRSLTATSRRAAASLLKERSTAVFVAASLLICIPLQFYYAFTNLFLNQSGVKNAAGKMSAGQFSELACMLLIPWFFSRLGVKYMLALGMSAWVLRYILFAYGNAGNGMWMLWAGILLHGICYDFFFVTGQIYVDRKAPQHLRAAAQGLISLITYGVGMFIGSWFSGAVVEHFAAGTINGSQLYQWRPIWIVSAVAAGVVLLGFLFTFSDEKTTSPQSALALPMQEAP